MTRAPSSLPFALQPNPSPQQLQIQQIQSHQRYISNLCRTGPIPQSRHSLTDPGCIILYLLVLISTITLFCINYFSSTPLPSPSFGQLNYLQKLLYGLDHTLPETLLSCTALIILGIIFVILVLLIPVVVGYFVIFLCFALLGFVLYSLIVMKNTEIWGTVQSGKLKGNQGEVYRIIMIVIVAIGIAIGLILNVMRIKKLRHLGSLMKVVKVVIKQNMPLLPIVMLIGLSGVSIGLWVGFVKMANNASRMMMVNGFPIPPVLVMIFVIVLWIWTHGLMMCISHYVCQSWVIHWYYKSNLSEVSTALQENWKGLVFKKLFRYHFGTCLYGGIFHVYTPNFIITLFKRIFSERVTKPALITKVLSLSIYSYIQTVMQCFNFCTSNSQMYNLRRRIKQKLPEIYMLGHFLEKTLRITLTIGALYLWFVFSYKFNRFVQNNLLLEFSLAVYAVMCLLIAMGIIAEVGNNVCHLFGLVSDTAVIAYSIDDQVQRVHFHQNGARSVPVQLRAALLNLEISIKIQDNAQIMRNSQFAQSNVIYNPINQVSPQPFFQPQTQPLYPSLPPNPY